MGPIGALSPAPNTYKYNRYMKGDVTTPLVVNFKLLKGHVNAEEAVAPESDIILDSVKHERIYMTEKVTRIPIREGRLRGTLFIPEGEGPFPGVIDLFGVAGGLLEYRSAQLASRGVASLTLAYFAFEDLPKKMKEIDLSYFEEGVDFLLSHPKIKKSGIGAIGVSKGADIANGMGAFLPKVKAVVSVNGLGVNILCPMKYKDLVIPELLFDISKVKILGPDLLGVRDTFYDSDDYPETQLPLHKSEAKYLFLCAKEDGNYKTDFEVDKAVARMKANGKTDYEVIKYDGAGHLLEPPYAPFSLATYHRVASSAVAWGGNSKDHTEAQVDSWRRIVEFLRDI
ncbi:Acyl-coenzyme A thioesterase 5 [Armadillidium nasatum]|uniref:Acyl-coenzyme A thioesterase 5 n=1 Tax=Armadillidium nasatum TaxID=96803 RepID=A0A5N5SPZ2_9CRUS|nr:Acyl-coenzyme A thioesterase 5 [Armadillidium nasatum]